MFGELKIFNDADKCLLKYTPFYTSCDTLHLHRDRYDMELLQPIVLRCIRELSAYRCQF